MAEQETVSQFMSKAILEHLQDGLREINQRLENGGRHLSRYLYFADSALGYIPIAEERCPQDPEVRRYAGRISRLAKSVRKHY